MDIYQLAVKLHWTQCRYNHTDQCAWDYELVRKGKWQSGAHALWLNKAYGVQANTDMPIEDIIKVLDALDGRL